MSDSDVYSFALKNALNEMQNACPDIKHIFMFRESGEIIAGDENTPNKSIVRVVDSFSSILEKDEAIGGVEGLTLEGGKGRVNISCMNNLYLVTVTSAKADMNYVNVVVRVLIPTVLRLLEKIHPTPTKNTSPSPAPEMKTKIPEVVEKSEEHPKEPEKPEVKSEQLPIEPPVMQFMVENLGGLLVPSDTVRIDAETMLDWEELYEGKNIENVEIETFDGKTTRCKVKPIKDSKYYGKGVIQIPDKIQLTLEIKRGELVRVKPIVE
jgi:hypothetical protein